MIKFPEVKSVLLEHISIGQTTIGGLEKHGVWDYNDLTVQNLTVSSAEITSLDASKITGQIIDAQIANIDWAKITNIVVETAHIQDLAVTNAKVYGDLDAAKLTIGTLSADRIGAGSIDASKIAANTITANEIAAGTITANEIAADTITANEIAASTITATELNIGTLSAISADLGTVTAGTLTGITRLNIGASNVNPFYCYGTLITSGGELQMGGNIAMGSSRITGDSGDIEFGLAGRLQVSTHFDPPDGGSMNLGGATRYWGDVSYKTLTDRGCLGWFDDGVEMPDGKIVSDVEALRRIKKHPRKKTIYGVPRLDYKTLPKVVYKKATDHQGKELKRDRRGRPYITEKGKKIYAEDGAELTSLISIMIGAIKELDNKINMISKK